MAVDGNRDIGGLWVGDGGEGVKYWLQVLTEITNRGVQDVLMLVGEGLKGLPEAVATVWPAAIVQTCVVHLMRNSFRYSARVGLGGDLRRLSSPSTRGATVAEAEERFLSVPGEVGAEVPGDRQALVEQLGFSSCRSCSSIVRSVSVVCTTNAIRIGQRP